MRKVFVLLLLLVSLGAFSQALNEASYYRVANSSTAFGKNVPIGTLIYDVSGDALYEITAAATSATTLTTATKTEIGVGDVTKVGTPANTEIAVWTGDGTLGRGSDLTFDGATLLQEVDGLVTTFNISQANTVGINSSALRFSKYYGADHTTYAALPTSATLGRIDFYGSYSASSVNDGASIQITTTEAWSTGNNGTKLEILTVSNGSSINIPKFNIDGDGNTNILKTLYAQAGTTSLESAYFDGINLGAQTMTTPTAGTFDYSSGFRGHDGTSMKYFADITGTPSDNQIPYFTDANTIESSDVLTLFNEYNLVNSSASAGFSANTYSTISSAGGMVKLYRYDGTSGAYTAVDDGENLGYIYFGGSTSASTDNYSVLILAKATENWSEAYNGTELSISTITNQENSQSERFKIDGDGNTNILNGSLNLTASTASLPSLNIPHGTAPSSPTNGDIWTTSTSMYARINGSTVDLGAAGSGAGISGTPADSQIAIWTGTTDIEGDADFTWDGATFTMKQSGTSYLSHTLNQLSSDEPPGLEFKRAMAGETYIVNGETIGEINFYGYSAYSSAYALGAKILVDAQEDFTGGANYGSAMSISTTTYGSSSTATRLYLGGNNTGISAAILNGSLKTAASTTSYASFNMPHGSAPSSPNNGDMWTTTSGIFAQINSVDYNLIPSGSTGNVQYYNSDGFGAEAAFTYAPASNTLTVDNITSVNELTLDASNSGSIMLDSDPGGSGWHHGVVATFSGTIASLQAVYISSNNTISLADADAATTMPAIGITISTDEEVLTHGYVMSTSWSWTAGDPVYVSTTAGGLTQTAPSGTGDQVQVIGIAVDANAILIMPDLTLIER